MRTSNYLSRVPNIRHAFFNRNGGVSEGVFASLNTSFVLGDDEERVVENRRRICAQMGVSTDKLFVPKQVHGDVIVRIVADSSPDEIAQTQADAIWTTEPGFAVGVQTADCAPLLLADKVGSAVMAVHLGWRGAANGLAQKSVRMLCQHLHISPQDLVAAIGPCIGFDLFEVGPEVVESLKAQVKPEGLVRQRDSTHFDVDLEGWIERELQAVGLIEIDRLRECTVSNPERYFSFRRDKGHTGRQISTISKK